MLASTLMTPWLRCPSSAGPYVMVCCIKFACLRRAAPCFTIYLLIFLHIKTDRSLTYSKIIGNHGRPVRTKATREFRRSWVVSIILSNKATLTLPIDPTSHPQLLTCLASAVAAATLQNQRSSLWVMLPNPVAVRHRRVYIPQGLTLYMHVEILD